MGKSLMEHRREKEKLLSQDGDDDGLVWDIMSLRWKQENNAVKTHLYAVDYMPDTKDIETNKTWSISGGTLTAQKGGSGKQMHCR